MNKKNEIKLRLCIQYRESEQGRPRAADPLKLVLCVPSAFSVCFCASERSSFFLCLLAGILNRLLVSVDRRNEIQGEALVHVVHAS